jgi:hypothetical protein
VAWAIGTAAGTRSVCAYDLYVGIDSLEYAAFLIQGETDELWTTLDLPPTLKEFTTGKLLGLTGRIAVHARHQPDRQISAAVMLDALFEAGLGFCWPTKHLISGIIDRELFTRIVGNIEARIDARQEAARNHGDSAVVLVAKECQLDPRPSGTSPPAWMANCPGTNHWLMIGADSNTWGCGWCKRGGGPDELRAFVMEHKPTAS